MAANDVDRPKCGGRPFLAAASGRIDGIVAPRRLDHLAGGETRSSRKRAPVPCAAPRQELAGCPTGTCIWARPSSGMAILLRVAAIHMPLPASFPHVPARRERQIAVRGHSTTGDVSRNFSPAAGSTIAIRRVLDIGGEFAPSGCPQPARERAAWPPPRRIFRYWRQLRHTSLRDSAPQQRRLGEIRRAHLLTAISPLQCRAPRYASRRASSGQGGWHPPASAITPPIGRRAVGPFQRASPSADRCSRVVARQHRPARAASRTAAVRPLHNRQSAARQSPVHPGRCVVRSGCAPASPQPDHSVAIGV